MRQLLSALALALVLLGGAGPAPAQQLVRDPVAARHYEKGRKLYRQKRYDKAEEAFRKAYALDSTPKLLFNMAKCQEKGGRHIEAISSYEGYLDAKPNAGNRKEVELTIRYLEEKALRTHLHLYIRTTPPGASVYMDGSEKPVAFTPSKHWLSRGKHRVRLHKEGHLPITRQLDIAKLGTKELELTLVPEDAPARISFPGALAGAQVMLDGKPAGTTPLKAPLELSPGKHKVKLSLKGRVPFFASLRVEPGSTTELKVEMPALDAAARPAPKTTEEPSSKTSPSREEPAPEQEEARAEGQRSLLTWKARVCLGLSIAGLALGTSFYLGAASAHEEAKDVAAVPGGDRSKWNDLLETSDQRLLLAQVSYAVAGAAAIAAGVLITINAMSNSQDEGTGEVAAQRYKETRGPKVMLLPLERGAGLVVGIGF